MKDRIKTALVFLKEGQFFTVGDLKLSSEKTGVIEVTGWSQYTNYANLTKRQCLMELEEIKDLFYKMVNISPELQDFIKDKSMEFNLFFDDYGKGSILLCSEKQKTINWDSEILNP